MQRGFEFVSQFQVKSTWESLRQNYQNNYKMIELYGEETIFFNPSHYYTIMIYINKKCKKVIVYR